MGSKRNKIFESLFYLILISLVIILFYRFTMQNSNRIQEQNRVYAEDSARQIAKRIADHFASAQQLIKTYTYFLEHTLDKPEVTNLMLAQLEKTSSFDGIRFTDLNGQNYSSEGSIVKTTDREFYIKGIAGKSGITTIQAPEQADSWNLRARALRRQDFRRPARGLYLGFLFALNA